MMCGGSRDDHVVMHMRPFSDDAQNLGGHSQICVVSCHGLEMPADMMDTDCSRKSGLAADRQTKFQRTDVSDRTSEHL